MVRPVSLRPVMRRPVVIVVLGCSVPLALAGLLAGCWAWTYGEEGFTGITIAEPGLDEPEKGPYGGHVAWGDYDGDGDYDLAYCFFGPKCHCYTVHGNTRVYRNDGGELTDTGEEALSADGTHAAWGDCDSDGDIDLALHGVEEGLDENRRSAILLNEGGALADSGARLKAMADATVAWGDFDNDGAADLAIVGFDPTFGRGFNVYRNDEGLLFDLQLDQFLYEQWHFAWGDCDNDGDMDFMVLGSRCNAEPPTYEMVSEIRRNDGGGVFTGIDTGLHGTLGGCGAWGDYDADGDLDLAIAGDGPGDGLFCRVYRNDGAGRFTDIHADLVGIWRGAVAWGDYDNDGDLDLAVAGADRSEEASYYAGTCRLYRNDAGTFADSGFSLIGASDCSLAWCDYDDDGDLDLTVAGSDADGHAVLRIYRNEHRWKNTPPGAPARLDAVVLSDGAEFSWEAAVDVETPSPGLTYNLRVGTSPEACDVMSPMSLIGGSRDGRRLVPAMGNVQHNLSWALHHPPRAD